MTYTHKVLGRIVHELKPYKGNPRNSEGSFIKLDNGDILFAYSKFTGSTCDDDDTACIASIISKDDGETWEKGKILATPDEHDCQNVMSVSLLKLEEGIGLFYLVRHGWDDMRMYMKRSYDGKVWSRPTCCMPSKGYYEVHNDRVIRLASGRIVIPAAFYHIPWHNKPNLLKPFRGTGVFLLSGDDGFSWRESHDILQMPIPKSTSGMQETGVVEMSNGDLWAWFRTDMGFQYESFSRDRGDSWTVPQPSIFKSCNSPMSMKREGDDICAVWNPLSDRTGFAIINSDDEGFYWYTTRYIEDPMENNSYCYTAIHFTDDSILLAYSVGSKSGMETLRIRKISKNYWKLYHKKEVEDEKV